METEDAVKARRVLVPFFNKYIRLLNGRMRDSYWYVHIGTNALSTYLRSYGIVDEELVSVYSLFFLNWLLEVRDIKDGLIGLFPPHPDSPLRVYSDLVYADAFGLNLVVYDFNNAEEVEPYRWLHRIKTYTKAFSYWGEEVGKAYLLHLATGERIFYDPEPTFDLLGALDSKEMKPGPWCNGCDNVCFEREKKKDKPVELMILPEWWKQKRKE